ncbi:MAG: acyltransferase [Planctomycetaceae bacterium]|nr:acyltransferase [Planctomycetaceae bacterium]
MLFKVYSKRNLGLDVLRALAISMVFIGHGVSLHGLPILGELGTGVDLFFVLSGFLIGRIYFRSLQDDKFALWEFWQARWWRTLPPYFVAIGFYALAMNSYSQEPVAGYYALFMQNFVGMVGFNASWSLCVEEHFYLLFPLLGCAVERCGGRYHLRWLLPVAFLTPLALRLATLNVIGDLPTGWFWMSHLHCEGLIAGVWLAYVKVEQPAVFAQLRRPMLWLTPLIPVLLAILPMWTSRGPAVNVWVFTLLAVGYAAWVRVMLDFDWSPTHRLGRWALVGVHLLAISSYSIYLTHSLSFAVLRELVEHWPRGVLKTGFILTGSLVIASVFYLLFERTTLVLRDRYLRREPQSVDDLLGNRKIELA